MTHIGFWAMARDGFGDHGRHEKGEAMATVNVPGLHGVDLASFQGSPDHWSAIAGPISWAAVKLTEYKPDGSRYVNPTAAADLAFLSLHGKGRIFYLFGHPASSAANTAAFFASEAKAHGLTATDGICLDHEVTDGKRPADVAAWACDVASQLRELLHREPLIYSFLSFAEEGNCAGLGRYPLWIADPSSPMGRPRVPEPWRDWAIHQHVTGGPIDRDVTSWASLDAMQAAVGSVNPGPAHRKAVSHVTQGSLSLAGLLAKHPGVTPAAVLRLTAEHGPGGKFAVLVAAWVNGVFRGDVDPAAPMPEGLKLWLPA